MENKKTTNTGKKSNRSGHKESRRYEHKELLKWSEEELYAELERERKLLYKRVTQNGARIYYNKHKDILEGNNLGIGTLLEMYDSGKLSKATYNHLNPKSKTKLEDEIKRKEELIKIVETFNYQQMLKTRTLSGMKKYIKDRDKNVKDSFEKARKTYYEKQFKDNDTLSKKQKTTKIKDLIKEDIKKLKDFGTKNKELTSNKDKGIKGYDGEYIYLELKRMIKKFTNNQFDYDKLNEFTQKQADDLATITDTVLYDIMNGKYIDQGLDPSKGITPSDIETFIHNQTNKHEVEKLITSLIEEGRNEPLTEEQQKLAELVAR